MSLRLEPVSPVHVPVLAAMHRICFVEVWDEASMADILAMPGTFGLLALEGAGEAAKPAAFVLCRVAADEAEILTILVLPPYRRQGLASQLLQAAKDKACSLGASAMFLEAAETNSAALALYSSHQFFRVGRRPNYYGGKTAALVLRCELSG